MAIPRRRHFSAAASLRGLQVFPVLAERRVPANDNISGLVLRLGQSGRTWRWHDLEYADGPSDYRHAVRFASQELGRKFHEEWMG